MAARHGSTEHWVSITFKPQRPTPISTLYMSVVVLPVSQGGFTISQQTARSNKQSGTKAPIAGATV